MNTQNVQIKKKLPPINKNKNTPMVNDFMDLLDSGEKFNNNNSNNKINNNTDTKKY